MDQQIIKVIKLAKIYSLLSIYLYVFVWIYHGCLTCIMGVVGWCEGAVYLTSLGCPNDIGLQLGKACYPCSG